MIRLTDEQWERIREHFPEEHIADGRPGRKPIASRRVLEAVLWILNTGAQWHMLPQSYPNYKTVHRRFQAWCRDETLRRILTDVANDLRDRGVLDEEECFIDATFVMAKGGGGDSLQPQQAAHARSAPAKPLHATLARRALLRLDPMAAPHPRPLGVSRPELPRFCPTRLPRYPLQTILRMGWTGRAPALSDRASKHEEHAAMSQKTSAVAVRTIGIDTGKNTFHLIGLDEQGTIVLREKLARGRIARRLANASPCLIGIEAGMATHYVARELLALGHDVRQVPPAYAKPFRQGHKNDFRDAYAIAEAVLRPSTRCVPVKTDDQLDLQALHRVRSRLVGQRTAVINQIRSFLLERGIAVRQGPRFLRQRLPEILAKRIDVLSPRMIAIIEDLSGDWRRLDERVERVTEEIEQLAHGSESCRQLMTVPGIGPLIASAMVAAIANGAAFAKGRDFAAWLGLVPKQMSTGDRTILGHISKRGNRYLRTLFMQGARVILLRPANWARHSFRPWLTAAAKRLHHNVLATALANKLARIAWTVLAQRRNYETRVVTQAA
jgi:transposase